MSLDAGLPGLVPQAPTASVAAADRGGTGIAHYSAGNFLRAANELELEQRTPAQVLSDIGAAAAAHTHSASDITSGTLAVVRGGTGISSYTAGNYIRAASASSLEQRTPAQVLGDIGAAAASHTHAPGDIDGITGPAVIGRVSSASGPASAISPVHSVALDATGLRLVNDTASPGNNQYYGTNASGVRGWYSLPSGGGGGTAGIEPWRWYVMQALVSSGTDIYTLFGERLVEVQMRPFHGHAATNSSPSGTGAAATTVGNTAPTWLQGSNGPHRAPARLTTGTTATGAVVFYAFPLTSERVDAVPFSSARPFCWGDIAVDTLSTSAERFHVRAGFAMSPLYNDHAANVLTTFSLYYRDDVNGGRWAILWRTIDSNGAQTLVDTGITVADATRVRFCFVAISDNQMRAWVRQGSSEYRDTITVSSSPVLNTVWAASIVKSVGTTARFLWVRDYGSGVWYPS